MQECKFKEKSQQIHFGKWTAILCAARQNKPFGYIYQPTNYSLVTQYGVLALEWSVSFTNIMSTIALPDSKVHGAFMGPTWGGQDPGGPQVDPMNLAIRLASVSSQYILDVLYINFDILTKNRIWYLFNDPAWSNMLRITYMVLQYNCNFKIRQC